MSIDYLLGVDVIHTPALLEEATVQRLKGGLEAHCTFNPKVHFLMAYQPSGMKAIQRKKVSARSYTPLLLRYTPHYIQPPTIGGLRPTREDVEIPTGIFVQTVQNWLQECPQVVEAAVI